MPISQDEHGTTSEDSGRASKPSVGVVARPGEGRSTIARQLALVAVLHFLDTVDALDAAIAGGSIDVVVTDVEAWRHRMIARRAGVVPGRPLGAPLIVYDRAEREVVDALPALLAPGMAAEFVVRPDEPLAPAVRRAVANAIPPAAGPVILRRLLPLAPASLHVFLSIAVLKGATGRGVAQLAHWSRISPSTAERRLAKAGWATAHVVLQTVRALDALWLMSEYQWTARRIQRAREFAHSSAITRLMQRYLNGLTPAAVRESAGFDTALNFVCRTIVHRTPHA